MTQVLYIGNWRPPHSSENEWRVAFEANGVGVIMVQEDEAPWLDIARTAKAHKVLAVIWTHTHNYTDAETYPDIRKMLAGLRKAKIPCVGLHLDRWWGLDREVQISYDPYFEQSLLCTADGGHDDEWERVGINHAWFPPAVSHVDAERDVEPKRQLRMMTVGFIGSWHGYHPEWPWREQLVLWLRRTYGSRLALYPKYGRSIRGKDLSTVYQSVPVLVGDSCLAPKHDGSPMSHYWSDRIPECVGRGGFLLHPYVEGLEEHFDIGGHLVCYEPFDFDALKFLIKEWNAHPDERQKITKAGREHVIEYHTYKRRVEQLLPMINGGLADWT